MRNFYPILILTFSMIFSLSLFAVSPKLSMSVYQARGLKKDNCYTEQVAISCKDQCTMNLFPMTQAQLSLSISQVPKDLRMAMGHFFEVNFKVKTDSGNEVEILKWSAITTEKIKKEIQGSDGNLRKRKCR